MAGDHHAYPHIIPTSCQAKALKYGVLLWLFHVGVLETTAQGPVPQISLICLCILGLQVLEFEALGLVILEVLRFSPLGSMRGPCYSSSFLFQSVDET